MDADLAHDAVMGRSNAEADDGTEAVPKYKTTFGVDDKTTAS